MKWWEWWTITAAKQHLIARRAHHHREAVHHSCEATLTERSCCHTERCPERSRRAKRSVCIVTLTATLSDAEGRNEVESKGNSKYSKISETLECMNLWIPYGEKLREWEVEKMQIHWLIQKIIIFTKIIATKIIAINAKKSIQIRFGRGYTVFYRP